MIVLPIYFNISYHLLCTVCSLFTFPLLINKRKKNKNKNKMTDGKNTVGMKVKRSRKKHKNSKLGCANCKKRQIKCDETLPACQNCIRRNDACSYLFLAPQEFQKLMEHHQTNSINNSMKSEVVVEQNNERMKNLNVDKMIENDEFIRPIIEMSHMYTDGNFLRKYESTPQSYLSCENDAQFNQPYVKVTPSLENGFINDEIILKNNVCDLYLDSRSPMNTNFIDYNNFKREGVDYTLDFHRLESDYDSENTTIDFHPNIYVEEALPGAKSVNKTITINRNSESDFYDLIFDKTNKIFTHLYTQSLDQLFKIYGYFEIDTFLERLYCILVTFFSIFSRLVQKSMLLFVNDIIKSIIMTQRTLLPIINHEMRIKICLECDAYSNNALNDLTQLINNDYLPNYHKISGGQREVMVNGFLTISTCTPYHYNHIYRHSTNFEHSKKCAKLVDTFTTGMFSILINEKSDNKTESEALKFHKEYIHLSSKLIIIKNYNTDILSEILHQLQLLHLDKIENFGTKIWGTAFINIVTFLSKHSGFLNKFRIHNTLLGYDKIYLIGILNEWYQIFPHNISHLGNFGRHDEDSQIMNLILLVFIALRYYLVALVPGMRSLMKTSFIQAEKVGYNTFPNLMNTYKSLTIKEYKIFAIYLIRIETFFNLRLDRYKNFLSIINIPEFSSEMVVSSEEIYQGLLSNWKLNNVLNEIQRNSFSLFSGTYIQDFNYASLRKLDNKFAERMIDFKTVDEMIMDFEATNTGFFSRDYDTRSSGNGTSDIIEEVNNVNKESGKRQKLEIFNGDVTFNIMKNCWRFEGYIKKVD